MRRSVLLVAVILIALGVGLLMLLLWGVQSYNRFVTTNEQVTAAWSQVQNQYQRRMDLIPNIVNVVKGVADFEKQTYVAVAEARTNASKIALTPELLRDPQAFAAFERAQGELSSAISRLLVTVERYPELKANQNFALLQDELAGTENRIAVERRRFNETVQAYNVMTKRFPGTIVARLMGFTERPYFQAAPAAAEAPKVQF